MIEYTYSEARQNLAAVLEQAAREGEVRIRRWDGRIFVLRPDRRRLPTGYSQRRSGRHDRRDRRPHPRGPRAVWLTKAIADLTNRPFEFTGNEVAPRKRFIQSHAKKVRNLPYS